MNTESSVQDLEFECSESESSGVTIRSVYTPCLLSSRSCSLSTIRSASGSSSKRSRSSESLSDSEFPIAKAHRARRRGVSEFDVTTLLTKKCCSRKSVTCFKKLSVADIESTRELFCTFKSEVSQTQYVVDYLHRHCDASRSVKSVLFSLAGKTVCQHCWRFTHGIKYTRFKAMLKKFEDGLVVIEHGKKGFHGRRCFTIRASVWLSSFVKKLGDYMPTDGSIHLPSCLTKSDVYELACEDLKEGNVAVCSRSTFFEMWNTEFSHVKIPPVNRFTKCDVCSAIREARMRTLDSGIRQWLQIIMDKHSELVMKERGKYKKHQQKAVKTPTTYMSIIIDGMDQSKTSLPHIPSNPKSIAGQFTLPTHLTGVHAHGLHTLMFVDWSQYPHDCNLTITVLMDMIHCCVEKTGSVPPTLYLQLDNTCRENKNKYVLTFAALMIQVGLFKKIKIGFLPVGHTHEDIDKVFSCISRSICNKTVLTVPDLLSTVEHSDNVSKPEGRILNQVFAVRDWISEITPALHDHLKAHQFKFENIQGRPRMFYKQWSTDDTWLPQQGMDLLQTGFPNQSAPFTVQPYFDIDNYKKLETTISKVGAYLEKSGAKTWWSDFMEQLKLTTDKEYVSISSNTDQWTLVTIPADLCIAEVENEVLSPTITIRSTVCEQRPIPIPGVGEVPFSWVGQIGRDKLKKIIEEESVRPMVKQLQKDLKACASTCLNALSILGAKNSDNQEVKDAISLCEQFANCSGRTTGQVRGGRIRELWMREAHLPTSSTNRPSDQRAAEVLGSSIVEVITQKKQQPPDLYIGSLRGRTSIRQNGNITKDLKPGMLVALNTESVDRSPPYIGKVLAVSSEPTCDAESKFSFQWYSTDIPTQKDGWLKHYHLSNEVGLAKYSEVLLYDFYLTNKGLVPKHVRDFLKPLYMNN